MKYFARDYGTLDADGTYSLGTTFLSVSASIIYVGEFVGALIAAPINDKFGRKAVFASAAISIIIGAIVQVCAYSIEGVFYVGRIFVGLGVGQFTATCLVYVADVAPSPIRGPALMMFQFMQSIAQFVGACVNQGTETIDGKAQYQLPMGLLTALPLTMLVLLIFTPESPVWFMSKDRRDDARKALIKINRSTTAYDPETDLKIIDDQIALDRELAAGSSWISLITDPIERRKLIYACGVMFAQQVRFPFLLLLLDTRRRQVPTKKNIPTNLLPLTPDQRHPILVHLRRRLRAIHRRRRTLHHQHHHLRRPNPHGRLLRNFRQQSQPPHQPPRLHHRNVHLAHRRRRSRRNKRF